MKFSLCHSVGGRRLLARGQSPRGPCKNDITHRRKVREHHVCNAGSRLGLAPELEVLPGCRRVVVNGTKEVAPLSDVETLERVAGVGRQHAAAWRVLLGTRAWQGHGVPGWSTRGGIRTGAGRNLRLYAATGSGSRLGCAG